MSRALIALACLGVSAHSLADPKKYSSSSTESAQSSQEQDWGVYSKLNVRVYSAKEIGQIKAIEAAVSKAEVPPTSGEAALIRMGMGVSQENAYKENGCCFDAAGRSLKDKNVAERLAVEEAMRRSGIEPGSEREEQLRAAAQGRAQTADGEEVNQQTMEDMAKEVAKQQAAVYTGAQEGSTEEAMVNTGVDVFWNKMKGWFD
ncbi:hypothetical protein IB286_01545 [Spongiibacter sp. KMU-158]|uniref:Uncharacterized protein n=1 Tax=Spongiibacter pelagi TaxID=2760804 RepID=A0A927GVA5_9GAMM|nr:hypothetical protein [Spongiibacter pelagi]MBD2857672.1 hypothetical protein [Spongiibacter pelagi]